MKLGGGWISLKAAAEKAGVPQHEALEWIRNGWVTAVSCKSAGELDGQWFIKVSSLDDMLLARRERFEDLHGGLGE